MHHIAVIKTAQHMQDGIALADVGKELVAQPLSPAGALDKARNVHNIHSGRDGALRFAYLREDIKPPVGNIGGAEIRLDGTERKIGALGLA